MQACSHTATIDGKSLKVQDGQTILQAARKAGIYIPSLCYLEHIQPYGGCRLCMVEVKGHKGFPVACATSLEPGMEIRTKTPELQALRREILELILSEHPYTCLVCKDREDCAEFMHTTRKATTITGCNFCTGNGDCELQDLVEYLELKTIRYPISYRGLPPIRNNPFYDLDYNLCILCGRCVRVCKEERNSHVLEFVHRGNQTLVGTAFDDSQLDAGCEFCGACVDVCPTGSISGKLGKWAGQPDRSTRTTCLLCSVGCKMNVNTRGSRIVNVGPEPGEKTHPPQICLRAKFLLPDLNRHPARLMAPLVRKGDRWVEAEWEEALDFAAAGLMKCKGKGFGAVGSAQDTFEDNYMLQKFSRKVMQSNNIDLFEAYGDRNLVEEMISLGLMDGQPGAEEVLRADTLLLVGTDASLTHPLIENRVRKAFSQGKTVLYANPFSTRTSNFANFEARYRPGESCNFLLSLADGLVNGKPDVSAFGEAAERCRVPEKQLEQITAHLALTGNLVILAGDELLRQHSGRMAIRALYNIQTLTNRKGRCRILFLFPEGNYTAAVRAGVNPDMLPGFDPLSHDKSIEKWNRAWKTRLRKTGGLSYQKMIGNGSEKGIRALMVVGDIPAGELKSVPGFCIQLNQFHSAFSKYADVILPVSSFLEREGHTLALDGKTIKLKQALRGPESSKSISEIMALLARTMNEDGFGNGNSSMVWKEILEMGILPRKKKIFENGNILPLKPLSAGKKKHIRPSRFKESQLYRYRGNELSSLIPELQEILDHKKSRTKRK